MKSANTTLLGRGAVLLGVLVLFIVAMNVRGQATGITFATQGVDLKIDSKAYYDGTSYPTSTWSLKNLIPTADHFFNFSDIKPGDYGRTIVSMHVGKSPAFLCLDFTNLKSFDNGVNEPEALVDPNGTTTGELASGTEFFGWIDNGDGVYQPGEKILFGTTTQIASIVLNNTSYVIGDSKQNGSCGVNQTKYVGLAWCAGDLTVNTKTGVMTCDGGVLGNAAQTDSFTFDVGIRTESANENQKFVCSTSSPKPPPPPKCDSHNKDPFGHTCDMVDHSHDNDDHHGNNYGNGGQDNKSYGQSYANFNKGPVHW
jgi:hypothetical protein